MQKQDLKIQDLKADFKIFADNFLKDIEKPFMFGICRLEFGQKSHKVTHVSYPFVNVNENYGTWAVLCKAMQEVKFENNELIFDINTDFINNALKIFTPFLQESLENKQSHKNIQVLLELKNLVDLTYKNKARFQLVAIKKDEKPASIQSAYLKLHALSSRKCEVRSLNLDGIFGMLDNLAWSGNTAYELEYLRENEIKLRLNGTFPVIDYIDKFPRFLSKILPQSDNIRLLDSSKTRFGAYLGDGYVQMPGASYVNFNAGAMGPCMNEGRISSSVIVGKGTDIGGGASILGVLSGGNNNPITIGQNCLLGANSVTGISLGDGCIVDAGISILSGSVVFIDSKNASEIKKVNDKFEIKENNLYKGLELSGANGVHFRVDSQKGQLIAFRSAKTIELNKNLH